MGQNITVKIAEQTIPLVSKSPEHEELIRVAAKELNDKLTAMIDDNPDKSIVEILSIIALNRSIVVAGLKKQHQMIANAEESLLKELDGYLENIDKNSR
ncbi:MAG: cell division protein ZapA [Bacteroidales bacterium]|nr:cell division protein ZapA [Bacteroidales bacterium]